MPVLLLQPRLKRERPDLPDWRTPQALRDFLKRVCGSDDFTLRNDTLVARLPCDYKTRTEAVQTIIRVLAQADGYAALDDVARLARTWIPSLKVPSAEALAAYAGGLKSSPYRLCPSGRITTPAARSGLQPPSVTYYPRVLAKQVRLELGQAPVSLCPSPGPHSEGSFLPPEWGR